jgi:hypothetical protein
VTFAPLFFGVAFFGATFFFGAAALSPQLIPCVFAQSCHSGTGWLTVQRKWYVPLSPTNLKRFLRSVASSS